MQMNCRFLALLQEESTELEPQAQVGNGKIPQELRWVCIVQVLWRLLQSPPPVNPQLTPLAPLTSHWVALVLLRADRTEDTAGGGFGFWGAGAWGESGGGCTLVAWTVACGARSRSLQTVALCLALFQLSRSEHADDRD